MTAQLAIAVLLALAIGWLIGVRTGYLTASAVFVKTTDEIRKLWQGKFEEVSAMWKKTFDGLLAEDAASYVPGEWECPNCTYRVVSYDLSFPDGALAPRAEPVENRCPNCTQDMRRVLYSDALRHARRQVTELGKRLQETDEEDGLTREIVAGAGIEVGIDDHTASVVSVLASLYLQEVKSRT